MATRDATTAHSAAVEQEERHRLTALEGLAALSLDALSSVAYGPEAILIVLVAAGVAGLRYQLPITVAIVVLLAVLVISYRQVIEAFPGGGGAYAVAKRHLGTRASLVAAASLFVDYILNAAVGVSAGIEAITSAFPVLYGARVWLCLVALALLTAANLWGVADSARLFIAPTVAFIVSMAAVIVIGLIRSHPVVPPVHNLPSVAETVGILLILKAFASGCSALTGVEAIANAVPEFRQPRVRRAQHTEMWLGIILGAMLLGLAVLIRKFDVTPSSHITVLAQLVRAGVGQGVVFYVIQLITMVLLVLAANTSFAGLPVLASLVAKDNYLPHLFALKGERQVHRYGVLFLAVAAAALLAAVRGDTQALVPLFAIGVFVGFTLSQTGMVRHWYSGRQDGWTYRAAINGFGAVLTFLAIIIELISKFTQGAWLVVLVIPTLVVLFVRVHRAYDQMGALLELGHMPPPPHPEEALVIVPVAGLSRLTEEAISAAMSLGEEVVAIYVRFDDPEGTEAGGDFSQKWEQWGPDVPLITLHSHHRSLGPPVVEYLRTLEDEDSSRRLVVLIAEMEPTRPWEWLLHNQRGVVLDRAIRRGTSNVVVCRLGFRPANWTDVAGPGSGAGR
jgi:amino acid transporter